MGVDPSGLVDVPSLVLNSASFVISTGEAVGGIALMVGGGPLFPVGLGAALHGEYGMANSGIGVQNALFGSNNPGVAEGIGDAIAGYQGSRIGKAIDMFSGISSGVRGFDDLMTGTARETATSAVDIWGAIDTINSGSSTRPYGGKGGN